MNRLSPGIHTIILPLSLAVDDDGLLSGLPIAADQRVIPIVPPVFDLDRRELRCRVLVEDVTTQGG